jgi:hypothetical protein
MKEPVGERLLLGLAVHRTKLLTELVPDSRRGALISVQEAGSRCCLVVVSLAHAWELLSQALVPEAKQSSSLSSRIPSVFE